MSDVKKVMVEEEEEGGGLRAGVERKWRNQGRGGGGKERGKGLNGGGGVESHFFVTHDMLNEVFLVALRMESTSEL